MFVESESWLAACLAGDVALLGLGKTITSIWMEGLDIFNQSGYMRFSCVEGLFTLFYNLDELLLLDRRCLGQGCSGCSILFFTF
jgi:hypothetical protein